MLLHDGSLLRYIYQLFNVMGLVRSILNAEGDIECYISSVLLLLDKS